MNKTLSFVRLDFNLIKPYATGILCLLVLGIAMGFGFKSTSTLASYFMMSLMLIMSYPFAVGDKNGLDTLYGTLSLSKKNIVTGRYLFVLMLEIICVVLAFFCSWILSIVISTEFILANELFTLSLLSGVFSLIVSIQYPIYFKYGYNKAKILALIPLFIVFITIIQLPTLAKLFNWDFTWDTLLTNTMGNPFLMYVAPVVAGLVILFLSCLISSHIYAKRDI